MVSQLPTYKPYLPTSYNCRSGCNLGASLLVAMVVVLLLQAQWVPQDQNSPSPKGRWPLQLTFKPQLGEGLRCDRRQLPGQKVLLTSCDY